MKRKIGGLCLTLLLAGAVVLPVHAESYHGGSGWRVAFTGGEKMESNFKTADLDDSVSGMQPGDDITFTISLQNENGATTDWWMTNKVLRSLEDSSANSKTHGGAYTYILTYKDKSGKDQTLFSSERLGGDAKSGAGEGLHAATDALEEYFYLDTLSTGQSGLITLKIALDGETQGNDYQDTLADLQMNFAVELNRGEPSSREETITRTNVIQRTDENSERVVIYEEGEGGSAFRRYISEYDEDELIDLDATEVPRGNIVRTGDDTNLKPYVAAMTVSGIGVLILAIGSLRQYRREKKEEE